MSHEITRHDHMFSARGITPWHKLGTVLPGDVTRSADAITAARLDWSVSLAPSFAAYGVDADGRPLYLSAPMSRGVVREDTRTVLGTVGTTYTPLQNRDAFAAFDPWAEAGVITYETAGSLQGGRRVWILARLAADIDVGDGDRVVPYLLLTNSHGHEGGGPKSVTFKATGTRVVCANTLAMAMMAGAVHASIRHTSGVVQGVADAVATIDGIRQAAERQQATFRALAATPVPTNEHGTADAVLDYLAAVWREDPSELCEETKARTVAGLFAGAGEGSRLATADGTMWGLYNALTDYVTHTARTRGGDEGRAASTVLGGTGEKVLRRGIAVAWAMGREHTPAVDLASMETSAIEAAISASFGAAA